MNERLPAGRRPVGPAESTLAVEQRTLVDELRRMAGGLRPPYESASSMRFAFDERRGRDAADVSAAAAHVGVGLDGVFEQPFAAPDGPAPDTAQPPQTPAADADVTGPAATAGPAAAAKPTGEANAAATEPSPGDGVLPDLELPTTEAPRSEPATAGSQGLAERATRALAKGWTRDSERLFIESTRANSTDPYAWFGAGLAARARDPRQAAAYFLRAARYLKPNDPEGAAYAAIVATNLLESIGQLRTARKVLRDFARDLPHDCPAISLHLARLEQDRTGLVSEAILADPMLEADVVALDMDLTGEVIEARRKLTDRELTNLEMSILELRGVGGLAPGPVPPPDIGPGAGDPLALSRAEMNLWRRIELCDLEIAEARRRLEDREIARQEAETAEAKKAEKVSGQPKSSVILPFFFLSVAVAVLALVISYVGRWLSASFPRFAAPVSLTMWFIIVCLLLFAWYAFAAIRQPVRAIADARGAKEELPVHEYLVAQRRYDEIRVRRSYRLASQQAELVIQRALSRRTTIVPRRPDF